MAQWRNFTCDLAADGLHLGVQPIAHHIDALFAVIVNQIQRLHRVIQLAGVQAKRFDHILHIDLLGAIDFLGKIVAGAQGQQHHRGLCMRQAVGNLMYCAVAATADNDTAIAILCRISRCNLSGVAGMVRLFHNHLIIKKTKKGRKYYGCEANPDCDFMSWQKPSTEKCPECGSYMVEKGNKLVCANEQCGFVMPMKENKEEKED